MRPSTITAVVNIDLGDRCSAYIEPISRTQKCRTTQEGLTASGAKTARFTREAVEQALSTPRYPAYIPHTNLQPALASLPSDAAPYFRSTSRLIAPETLFIFPSAP
jgi:hypothetical protein